MTNNLESRLIELEIKIGFQEDLINALNNTVIEQQEQMQLLQAQLRLLYQNIPQKTASVDDIVDERPPHY